MNKSSLKLVVLISGSGSNLQAIINAVSTGELPVNIKAVISNRPNVNGLTRAQAVNIPNITLDHTLFETREAFDQQLIKHIDSYQADLIVLAGFMRILSDNFVNHYNGKLLNIHPSLLPELKGLNTHQRALKAGMKKHGATVHYVSNELDGGPLILQAIIDINKNESEASLQLRINQQEHIIYPMVIKWVAQQRLNMINQQVYLDKQLLKGPVKWINNQLII